MNERHDPTSANDEFTDIERRLSSVPQPVPPDSLLEDILAERRVPAKGEIPVEVPNRSRHWQALAAVVGVIALLALIAIMVVEWTSSSPDKAPSAKNINDNTVTPTLTQFTEETNPCHILPPIPDWQ